MEDGPENRRPMSKLGVPDPTRKWPIQFWSAALAGRVPLHGSSRRKRKPKCFLASTLFFLEPGFSLSWKDDCFLVNCNCNALVMFIDGRVWRDEHVNKIAALASRRSARWCCHSCRRRRSLCLSVLYSSRHANAGGRLDRR